MSSNRPVLFLGSLGATADMWADVARPIAGNAPVVVHRYPGHDGRAPETGADSVAALARDVVSLLDRERIESVDVVGLSLGGMVGMQLAAMQPERVHRLVAANCRFHQDDNSAATWDAVIARVAAEGVAAIVDRTLERWLTPAARRRTDLVERARAMLLATDARGYMACARAVRNFDAREFLDRLTAPLLLVSGATDIAAPADHMAQLLNSLPTARHATLPCAHMPPLELPEEFSSHVTRFLRPSAP